MPIAESLHERSATLREQWSRFRNRELSVDEFRELARELDDFLTQSGQETERIKSLMSEILMAQDYQDLTGQIIRRVIRLVQEVEENLVGLIRLSSARMDLPKADKPVADEVRTAGYARPWSDRAQYPGRGRRCRQQSGRRGCVALQPGLLAHRNPG
jgi:chemotaxis protein CheZ